MNGVSIGRFMLGLIVSTGVGTVVTNAIKITTPASINTVNKVLVGVGGFVLSAMVADQAVQYVNKEIDNLVKEEKSNEIKGS